MGSGGNGYLLKGKFVICSFQIVILVNFKNYREASGDWAIRLAKICEKVSGESGIALIPVVSALDLFRVKSAITGPVWVQHVDGVGYGAYTGWLAPEVVKTVGVEGTLLNHSEHKLINDELRKSVTACKETGLKICICADSVEEATRVAELNPDFVAYEPPELIGNRERSVSSEHPDIILKVVGAINIPVLVGAGVHSAEDIRVGLKLGAKGFLVASDVVLAEDQEKESRELVRGFSNSR